MPLLYRETLSDQDVRTTAIFGAVWGVIEVVLGTALHVAHAPFRGVILSLIAVVILVCAKEFVRYRGSLVMVGAVAATLKGLSGAGFVFTPMLAILLEAILMEVAFTVLGIRRLSALLGGILTLLYTFSHGLITQGIFFGLDIYAVYVRALEDAARWLSIDAVYIWYLLAAVLACHALLGCVAAWFGWSVAQRTEELLQEEPL